MHCLNFEQAGIVGSGPAEVTPTQASIELRVHELSP
jgi:hypothetical protein